MDNVQNIQRPTMHRIYHYLNEVIDLIIKMWIYVVMVGVSIVGQMGFYLVSGKKESIGQRIGRFFMSACVGSIVVIFCFFHWPPVNGNIPLSAIIVIPIGILMSDKIVKFFSTIGLKQLIQILKGIDYNAIMKIVFKDKENKQE